MYDGSFDEERDSIFNCFEAHLLLRCLLGLLPVGGANCEIRESFSNLVCVSRESAMSLTTSSNTQTESIWASGVSWYLPVLVSPPFEAGFAIPDPTPAPLVSPPPKLSSSLVILGSPPVPCMTDMVLIFPPAALSRAALKLLLRFLPSGPRTVFGSAQKSFARPTAAPPTSILK